MQRCVCVCVCVCCRWLAACLSGLTAVLSGGPHMVVPMIQGWNLRQECVCVVVVVVVV